MNKQKIRKGIRHATSCGVFAVIPRNGCDCGAAAALAELEKPEESIKSAQGAQQAYAETAYEYKIKAETAEALAVSAKADILEYQQAIAELKSDMGKLTDKQEAERQRAEKAEAQAAALAEALEAMIIMSDTGPEPRKFDEAMSWRENDIKARAMADNALASYHSGKPPVAGSWSADDLRRAFVDGARWWEWLSTNGTMWQSDRNLAEAEAEKKYPVEARVGYIFPPMPKLSRDEKNMISDILAGLSKRRGWEVE